VDQALQDHQLVLDYPAYPFLQSIHELLLFLSFQGFQEDQGSLAFPVDQEDLSDPSFQLLPALQQVLKDLDLQDYQPHQEGLVVQLYLVDPVLPVFLHFLLVLVILGFHGLL